MQPISEAEKLILDQYAKYPKIKIQDIIKALYQSEFGCAHFVADENAAAKYLQDELARIEKSDIEGELIEPIGERFSRVNLHVLNECGLKPKTLLKLFIITSRQQKECKDDFDKKLNIIIDLCEKEALPFSKKEAEKTIKEYKESGMNTVHHTARFNEEYYPAYRVISNDLVRFIPLFIKIDSLMDQKESVSVAIEGKCTSGKSTLADYLSEIYDCNIFHMDSFFLQKHQRTEKRLLEPGGNVDYERFKEEVLDKLKQTGDFSYRPFDCSKMEIAQPVDVEAKKLNIVEGVYCMRPDLEDAYNLSVYLEVSYEKQLERLSVRNTPEIKERFIHEWIPLENRYFVEMDVKARCDLVID